MGSKSLAPDKESPARKRGKGLAQEDNCSFCLTDSRGSVLPDFRAATGPWVVERVKSKRVMESRIARGGALRERPRYRARRPGPPTSLGPRGVSLSRTHWANGVRPTGFPRCFVRVHAETQLAVLSDLLASSDFALPSLDCESCRAGPRLFTFSTTTGFVRPWL